MSRILDFNAASVKRFHDLGNGGFAIQTTTDVTKTVENAIARHREGFQTTGMGDKHVASIPVPVLDAWARARGKTYGDVMRDDKLMKQFLEDPDNGDFRIWKGAL